MDGIGSNSLERSELRGFGGIAPIKKKQEVEVYRVILYLVVSYSQQVLLLLFGFSTYSTTKSLYSHETIYYKNLEEFEGNK